MAVATEAEQQVIDLATGPVRVFRGGAGAQVLVLHHDFEATGWGAFHEQLARSFSVITSEMPGYGESARLDWARHPRDLAGVLLALVRRLGLREYSLVGLGFGGWVAAEMAAFAPADMARLVLVGAAGIKPESSDILDQVMMDHREYVRSGFAEAAAFEALFGERTPAEQKTRWEAARETIARISWKPYMYSYELPELLREMPVPTTVIWGTEDRVVPPECATRYANLIPNAAIRLVAGGGHWLDLERPAELAGIIAASIATE
ncbi:MAG: alpha/beta hydrolase [Chloroflexi bacterium]|nr:alpha/beta hydrolase [Chloroflexota bacterium]